MQMLQVIRRALASVAAALMLVAMPAAAIDPSYSGSWYNPPESGSGFNLEIFDEGQALLFWYTYDDNGDAIWLYSEGAIEGDKIEFQTYFAQGMRFSDLDTADKDNRLWGTLTMEFSDCFNATVTYQSTLTGIEHSPVGTRTHPVQRLVNIDSLPCRQPLEGYWVGAHRDPTLNNGLGAYADLSGVLTSDGRIFLSSQQSEEVFLGNYEIIGNQVTFAYEICPDDDGACVPASGSGTFALKDFFRGTGTSAPWGTQPFWGNYRTLYDRSVTLASLAGNWTLVDDDGENVQVTIGADGALSGSNDVGCEFSGQLGQPNATYNVFDYDGTLSGCAEDTWSGVAVNTDAAAGDRKRLEFRVRTDAGAMSFTLQRP